MPTWETRQNELVLGLSPNEARLPVPEIVSGQNLVRSEPRRTILLYTLFSVFLI
jgi:hypothetical protein